MHQSMSTAIPVARIRVMPGHNPRKFFEQGAFDRLVESIRTDGVITAITVRGNEEEGYELIAGERRLRASREAGLPVIPATIVDVDDATAKRMAMVENLDRRDLSVGEESLAAQQFVDAYDGDQQAAANALGWTLSRMKHRLQLLHASEQVMQSLMEGIISVGHAELLSTLPAETQDRVLAKVIESKATVQMLKEQLEGVSLSLDQAKFDKTDCNLCPHNSQTQAGLFDTTIAAGRCANKGCYTAKTNAFIESVRDEMREEFPSVALLTEKQPGSTIPLTLTGSEGVGPTQFAACRGCQWFGATIDNRLGPTTGNVEKPLCFNRSCHSEKREAYAAVIAPPPAPNPEQADTASTPDAPSSSASTAAKSPPAKKPAAPAARATPLALTQQYDRVMRETVLDKLNHGAVEPILALAVYGIATLASQASNESLDTVLKTLGIKRSGSGHMDTLTVAKLSQEPKATLQTLLQQASLRFFDAGTDNVHSTPGRINRRQLAALLVGQGNYDLQPKMRVDGDFLDTHTKSGLEQVFEESGFKAFYSEGEGGEKKYRSLLAMKKDDIINAVLAAGFDFGSYLPAALTDQQAALAKAAKSGR